MKTCKDCRAEKEDSDFYGIQGECKECTQKRVRLNYKKNLEYYKKYEVIRSKRPKRKKQILLSQRKQRQKFPHKYLARQAVFRAVQKGLLIKKPCEICGKKKVEAHHQDHHKALEVNWLCKKHHLEADRTVSF